MKEIKKALMCTLLVTAMFHGYSQDKAKMEKEFVVVGSVTVNGKTIEGYIKKKLPYVYDEAEFPGYWKYQEEIKFIDKETFDNTEKIKGKMYVKYTPKTCDSYKYEDLTFVSYKYADLSAIGTASIPHQLFLMQVKKYDNVEFLFHYQQIPVIGTPEEFRAAVIENSENPTLIYMLKGGKSPKAVPFLNVKKELAECPTILKNLEDGKYAGSRSSDKNFDLLGVRYYSNEIHFDRNMNVLEDYIKEGCR